MRRRGEGLFLWLLVLVVLIVSGLDPRDRATWVLETLWVMVGLPLVLWIDRRAPPTRLLSWLLALHALVLIYGGLHTYAETPLGFVLRDWLGFERNPWDRIGHWFQGFVPAILAREILVRKGVVKPGGWLFATVVSMCLAFSAFFEMLEWWAALVMGADADAFLATQGDVWDTQWDMFLALAGAIVSQLIFARMHGRQIAAVVDRPPDAIEDRF